MPHSLHILVSVYYYLDDNYSYWDEQNLSVVLVCISMMTNDIENFTGHLFFVLKSVSLVLTSKH